MVSGHWRLVKANHSRISELRPGAPVFVLSALSAQRKILGQFHNIKSVSADTVIEYLHSAFLSLCNSHLGFAFAPRLALDSGRPIGFRREVSISVHETSCYFVQSFDALHRNLSLPFHRLHQICLISFGKIAHTRIHGSRDVLP